MANLYSVFAHPHSSSTTTAINNLVMEIARDKGYTANTNNLYQQKFNPVLSANDMIGFRQGRVSMDIQEEQSIVRDSSLLVFGYPIWWAGMPAILKGWIDRVFSHGFAYDIYDGMPRGLLKDKKAIIVNTHGQPEDDYRRNGMFNAMNIVTDIGIFDFCGIEVIEHLYYEDNMMTTDGKAKLFQGIETDLLEAIPEGDYFDN